MAKADVVRAWVEKLLADLNGGPVAADPDGDYPFRAGSAGFYVRLMGTDEPIVQVFSVVLRGVRRTAALLSAVNEINTQIAFARVFWVRDQVLVETELLGLTLDREELDRALGSVSRIAQHYGEELQKTYGGRKTFEDPAPEPPPPPAPLHSDGTGLYL